MTDEITTTDARLLTDGDAHTLLRWRDWTNEGLVEGFNMQGLLNLYHASRAYMDMADWLKHEAGAYATYQKMRKNTELRVQ